MFSDSREVKSTPFSVFLQKEVIFDFGLTFALPNGLLSIVQLEDHPA